ncbi:hypothetical protein HXA34_17425 [Salipaludibacillus agaradhaerens]|uniref:Uncharacterized protein n=2 Tax=Salipaludibacillus agaradhaerens TaxID=76935 RepID=A0A9Q4AYE7_SALAG|nr:hypothetical protein [Salipaludibacillus agaradhaerens]MCR6095019.1 hypothetical protein [Salipaludibacillus agaradhaerens]MCR6115423.1 hypothetical protein [Salipaludibacillus agaradhaerens]MCR6120103.1 hypothetical protein [Salipaludibacillus agaradhaerens]
MMLQITERAANIYKMDMEVQAEEEVRLFVRGAEGFFLGVEKETSEESDWKTVVNGVRFFVKEDDLWMFDGKTLDFCDKGDCIKLH